MHKSLKAFPLTGPFLMPGGWLEENENVLQKHGVHIISPFYNLCS